MPRVNVEMLRRAYEAFNRGDLAGMSADAAPTFEYTATGVIPGAAGVYRGREEYMRFLEQWWGEFEEIEVDVHELIDAGDQVLASLTFRGRGKLSGVEAAWDLWQLWTVRDGKVTHGRGFTSREQALEAARLGD
jgi:ketosteroid isomerase-like protein